MLRIEAGLLLLDVDFASSRFAWTDEDRSTPIELGLGWMFRDLASDDRAFIGRRALERELADATSRWRMTGLVLDWHDYDQIYNAAGLIPPKDHTPVQEELFVYDDAIRQVGYATSFMYSPMLQRHIAMARVRPDLAKPGSSVRLEVDVNHRYEYVQATTALLVSPTGIAFDSAGNLYIAESGQHRIRRVSTAGIITTVAGNATQGFAGDNGPATSANLNAPATVAIDPTGILFIADTGNNRIRRVNLLSGTITTYAGGATAGFSGDGGPATSALLNRPTGGRFDASGNFYFTDSGRIRVQYEATADLANPFGNVQGGFVAAPASTGDGLTSRPLTVQRQSIRAWRLRRNGNECVTGKKTVRVLSPSPNRSARAASS
jgi:hypothetical protein